MEEGGSGGDKEELSEEAQTQTKVLQTCSAFAT